VGNTGRGSRRGSHTYFDPLEAILRGYSTFNIYKSINKCAKGLFLKVRISAALEKRLIPLKEEAQNQIR
jgi:hypothetical protein